MPDSQSLDPEALAELHHEERADRDQSVERDLDQADRLVEVLDSDDEPNATV